MNNLRAIREHLERYFINGYQNAYLQPKIVSIRIKLTEHTTSPTRYLDLVRVLSPLFNIKVLRNEHCIDEGIYVIGQHRSCEKFFEALIAIVREVEIKTFDYGMIRDKVSSIHGAELKSKYKGKYIHKFEMMIKGIQKNYDHYAKIRHILEHEKADQVSFISYMKSFPHLRNKTPLRWEEPIK